LDFGIIIVLISGNTFSNFKGWNGVEESSEERINGQRSGGVLRDRTNSVMDQFN